MIKNENLPLVTASVGLEGIMLSEISQSEKDKLDILERLSGYYLDSKEQNKETK